MKTQSDIPAPRMIDIEEDWPSKVALKYKIPIGTLACPYCGSVASGAITKPICELCENPYWDEYSPCP